jgi:hypothetical protein
LWLVVVGAGLLEEVEALVDSELGLGWPYLLRAVMEAEITP